MGVKPGFMMGQQTKKTTVVAFPVGKPTKVEVLQPKRPSNGRRRSKSKNRTHLQQLASRDAAVRAFILAQRTWESEFREHNITYECLASGVVVDRVQLVGWVEVNTLYARFRDWHELEGKDHGHELMSARAFRNACEREKLESKRIWDAEERRHHTHRRIKQPHPAMHGTVLEPVLEDVRKAA